MSTSMDCPRSVAQTQTGGGNGLAPGHHGRGTTPTRLADNVRSVTAEATCAVPPAIAPALAPATVAACAAYASAAQTAVSTVDSTMSSAIGHASANSTRAAARCRFFIGDSPGGS